MKLLFEMELCAFPPGTALDTSVEPDFKSEEVWVYPRPAQSTLFGDEEQERIERIFRIFRVGPSMHRKEVYAALRRFGCHVNVTQCRFLVVRRAIK